MVIISMSLFLLYLQNICVIRFIPGTSEEKAAYINMYSYLNSRSRCGVVENKDKRIKDFYIVPLASHSKIPDVLLPFDGPGNGLRILQLAFNIYFYETCLGNVLRYGDTFIV